MKIIHLSDLHIGKRVNGFSMIEDQQYILKEIIHQIEEENIDAIVMAGDIYDKSVPPAEAVALFDQFLSDLAKLGHPVLIITGNHDSAQRVAFGSAIMKEQEIYISPVYNGKIECITLQDEYGPVNFYLVPFIKPTHVRKVYPEIDIEDYNSAFEVVLDHLELDTKERNVLVAHQFVSGASICDSEERNVGGLDEISGEVFSQLDYVALGHLHGPQQVGRPEVRYCGTPLKYSFSEEKQKKSLTFVTIGNKGCPIIIETKPLKARHNMRTIKGTFKEILAKDYEKRKPYDDYLQIILTDEELIMEAIGKLRRVYPNIMHLEYDNRRTRASSEGTNQGTKKLKSPLQCFEEFYKKSNGAQMSPIQQSYIENEIRMIWEAE